MRRTSCCGHNEHNVLHLLLVVHDVDLQKLLVRFAIDRAGLVGADGSTHNGSFDVTFMACLPNMVVMAPSDEAELMHMVATTVAIDDRPSCFRFPRGNGVGVALPTGNKGTPLEVADARFYKPLDHSLGQQHEVCRMLRRTSFNFCQNAP
ncbi:hypothetical protein PIB30_081560 [Stylosanthes scabra]|uniref:Transketolase-like pyrimidine-binding domain-containing protein n=1 Tax=Stylosanthes scabra TaxID=79078 RepID=A0ABU6ZQC8_9FABA|nr:hypothetical protein [Stylosanthes scabra]